MRYLEQRTREARYAAMDLRALANLALEVILARGALEDRLRGEISEGDRRSIEEEFKRIKSLEEYIRRMYFILSAKVPKATTPLSYTKYMER